MDPSLQAASKVYDIDAGLASTTGKASIAARVSKSAMKYIHKEGRRRSRLVFDPHCSTNELVGPGSYDLGAWGSIASSAERQRGKDTHYMRSTTRKVDSLEWNPNDSHPSRLKPITTEPPGPPQTLDRLSKLPNGRIAPGETGRIDMDGVKFGGRRSPTLLFPFNRARQRPSTQNSTLRSANTTTTSCPRLDRAPSPDYKPLPKDKQQFYLSDRVFKPKAKKRARDVIPEDYFILSFDRRNGAV
eukprot:TRINITY_DN14318_c0_g1_i1.p1 TRINITY_DN14318_c0_g1~~TRINITY_DN14318_c0_g1_i1.p1  ORF type:complete len:244 (+),score=57.76 TRINITY_DN14318_c0_g1_i1:123-854(+)